MKILAIGDFHGSIPKNLNRIIEKNKIDLILSTGDICSHDRIEWKYWKRSRTGEKLIDILGKDKLKKLIIRELEKSKNAFKILNQMKIPLILVYGNGDITSDYLKQHTIKYKGIEDIIKASKNMKLLKCGRTKFNNLIILGHSGYRGYTAKKGDNFGKYPNRVIKINIKWKKDLEKLAKYARGDFIFLTHDVPLGKLDKVKNKKSPAYSEHMGDKFYLDFDKRYKPMIHICGHMHENQGIDKIGKTIIINSGFGKIGEAALIECPGDGKGKIKIKLIK